MGRAQSLLHGRWAVPVISGLLILASFTVGQILEEPFWGDVLMIAAAVVAGTPVVIKAVNALVIRVIGVQERLAGAEGGEWSVCWWPVGRRAVS